MIREMTREELLRHRCELRDGALHWRASGKPVALRRDKDGYLKLTMRAGRNGRTYYYAAHRAIWFLHYGEWPKQTIDHINRDKTDNRLENLRDIPFQENCRNRVFTKRRGRLGCTLPGAGIWFDHRRGHWRAEIGFMGKRIGLGCHRTEAEARAARAAAEKECSEVLSPTSRTGSATTPRLTPTLSSERI